MHKEVKSLANVWANRRQVEDRLGVVYVFTEEALQLFADKLTEQCLEVATSLHYPHFGQEQDEYAESFAKRFKERFGVK